VVELTNKGLEMADVKKEAPKKDTSVSLRYKQTAFGVKITRAKGQVPDSLKGLYTSETFAKQAVTSFYSQEIR
jgi:hypothetical protein